MPSGAMRLYGSCRTIQGIALDWKNVSFGVEDPLVETYEVVVAEEQVKVLQKKRRKIRHVGMRGVGRGRVFPRGEVSVKCAQFFAGMFLCIFKILMWKRAPRKRAPLC